MSSSAINNSSRFNALHKLHTPQRIPPPPTKPQLAHKKESNGSLKGVEGMGRTLKASSTGTRTLRPFGQHKMI